MNIFRKLLDVLSLLDIFYGDDMGVLFFEIGLQVLRELDQRLRILKVLLMIGFDQRLTLRSRQFYVGVGRRMCAAAAELWVGIGRVLRQAHA